MRMPARRARIAFACCVVALMLAGATACSRSGATRGSAGTPTTAERHRDHYTASLDLLLIPRRASTPFDLDQATDGDADRVATTWHTLTSLDQASMLETLGAHGFERATFLNWLDVADGSAVVVHLLQFASADEQSGWRSVVAEQATGTSSAHGTFDDAGDAAWVDLGGSVRYVAVLGTDQFAAVIYVVSPAHSGKQLLEDLVGAQYRRLLA